MAVDNGVLTSENAPAPCAGLERLGNVFTTGLRPDCSVGRRALAVLVFASVRRRPTKVPLSWRRNVRLDPTKMRKLPKLCTTKRKFPKSCQWLWAPTAKEISRDGVSSKVKTSARTTIILVVRNRLRLQLGRFAAVKTLLVASSWRWLLELQDLVSFALPRWHLKTIAHLLLRTNFQSAILSYRIIIHVGFSTLYLWKCWTT